MAIKDSYTVEKKINGKVYVAQFSGLSVALKAVDASYIEGTTTTSLEKLSEYLFKSVIVDPPNLSVDDFDTLEELTEVVNFAREVMQGEFRKEKDKKSTKGASKE